MQVSMRFCVTLGSRRPVSGAFVYSSEAGRKEGHSLAVLLYMFSWSIKIQAAAMRIDDPRKLSAWAVQTQMCQ